MARPRTTWTVDFTPKPSLISEQPRLRAQYGDAPFEIPSFRSQFAVLTDLALVDGLLRDVHSISYDRLELREWYRRLQTFLRHKVRLTTIGQLVVDEKQERWEVRTAHDATYVQLQQGDLVVNASTRNLRVLRPTAPTVQRARR